MGRRNGSASREDHTRVYRRDNWTCRMPECLCPDGRAIDPALRGIDGPWAPSIDHITELARGGEDSLRNMRAAHKRCNAEEAAALAPLIDGSTRPPEPLTTRIGDLYPELAERFGL